MRVQSRHFKGGEHSANKSVNVIETRPMKISQVGAWLHKEHNNRDSSILKVQRLKVG